MPGSPAHQMMLETFFLKQEKHTVSRMPQCDLAGKRAYASYVTGMELHYRNMRKAINSPMEGIGRSLAAFDVHGMR